MSCNDDSKWTKHDIDWGVTVYHFLYNIFRFPCGSRRFNVGDVIISMAVRSIITNIRISSIKRILSSSLCCKFVIDFLIFAEISFFRLDFLANNLKRAPWNNYFIDIQYPLRNFLRETKPCTTRIYCMPVCGICMAHIHSFFQNLATYSHPLTLMQIMVRRRTIFRVVVFVDYYSLCTKKKTHHLSSHKMQFRSKAKERRSLILPV